MSLLTISDFSCAYGNVTVLQSLNLSLVPGQVISILGSNGAGKSTLLKCILGLTDSRVKIQGEIAIMGHRVQQKPMLARQYVAYVPEHPAVYEHLSALDNIRYFLSLGQTFPSNFALEPYLQQVGLSPVDWHRPCSEYSKGMKQKVMLALALAKQAKLLLLDEPNSGLDPQTTEELNQLILQCKRQGMGILVVTHDVLSAMAFSDQLMMLAKGQLSVINVGHSMLTLNDLQRLYQGQACSW